MGLFAELRRRNVFRVGIAYVLIAWVALQGAAFDRLDTIVTLFGPWETTFGPWETTVFILDPVFDPVRDHPRFVALAEQNRAWLETVSP